MPKITKPISIVCCPNSGSSILQRALLAHPDLCGPPLMERPDAYGQLLPIDTQDLKGPLPKVTKHWLKRNGRPLTFRRWAIPRFGGVYHVTEDDWTPYIDRQVKSVFGRYVEPNKRLVFKSPADSLRMRLFQRIFPDASFIWIIRNGYAVAKGIRERALFDPARPHLSGLDISPSEAAQQWYYANTAIMLDWPKIERGLIVRYEDLVGRTRETLYKILDFLELPKKGFPIPRFKRILNQKRIDQMSEEEIQTVSQIGWPLLKAYGYKNLRPYNRRNNL